MTIDIGLVAGEPSGDLIASQVLQGLQARVPELRASGIGGPNLSQCGMNLWHPMDALSVFGYVDALKSLPRLYRIFQDVHHRWRAIPPDVFVGVDAPDFNLRLEQKLHAYGIPTVHFVSPSIWAWRYERIEQIRRSVSHMLVLFPFELEIYQRESIPATYVGHPLADRIAMTPDQGAAREALGLTPDDKIIAILPGSRASEIRLMAPRFLAAAKLLQARDPTLQFVVPMVNETRRQEFAAIAKQHAVKRLAIINAEVATNHHQPASWLALAACDMAMVTSGTATLEAALFKRPMVISYVLTPMMRRLMAWKSGQKTPALPWIGLPNVLAKEFVVPELLQEDATGPKLADHLWGIWNDQDRRAAIVRRFETLHRELRCGTAQKASQAILTVLENAR